MSNNPTLRIIPHPEKSMRVYRTKTDKIVEGKIVRPRGTIMYRYLVVGRPDEIRAFRLARGEYYREIDKGNYAGYPLWSDQRRFNKSMDLVIVADGSNVVVAEDDFKLAIIDKMKQAKDFGPAMEMAIAQRLADLYVSDIANPVGPSLDAPKMTPSGNTDIEVNDDDIDMDNIPEGDDESIEDPLNLGA